MVEFLNSKSGKNVSVLIKNLMKLFRYITSLPSAKHCLIVYLPLAHESRKKPSAKVDLAR